MPPSGYGQVPKGQGNPDYSRNGFSDGAQQQQVCPRRIWFVVHSA
jgi:hypothetical protein